MAEYTLSKWSLDDLLKNPTRSTFDKKLAELNNYAREFASSSPERFKSSFGKGLQAEITFQCKTTQLFS
jgi:hypothetical protein